MKKSFLALIVVAALALPTVVLATVETPRMVFQTTAPYNRYIEATVTNDTTETQTAELWQSIFQIGPDGQRVRRSQVLLPGETFKFSVLCVTTRATYSWWTKMGNQVSTKLSVKCK